MGTSSSSSSPRSTASAAVLETTSDEDGDDDDVEENTHFNGKDEEASEGLVVVSFGSNLINLVTVIFSSTAD